MARLGLFHCRCRAYTLKNPRATSTGGGAPILSLLVYGYWLLYKVQLSSSLVIPTTLSFRCDNPDSKVPYFCGGIPLAPGGYGLSPEQPYRLHYILVGRASRVGVAQPEQEVFRAHGLDPSLKLRHAFLRLPSISRSGPRLSRVISPSDPMLRNLDRPLRQ